MPTHGFPIDPDAVQALLPKVSPTPLGEHEKIRTRISAMQSSPPPRMQYSHPSTPIDQYLDLTRSSFFYTIDLSTQNSEEPKTTFNGEVLEHVDAEAGYIEGVPTQNLYRNSKTISNTKYTYFTCRFKSGGFIARLVARTRKAHKQPNHILIAYKFTDVKEDHWSMKTLVEGDLKELSLSPEIPSSLSHPPQDDLPGNSGAEIETGSDPMEVDTPENKSLSQAQSPSRPPRQRRKGTAGLSRSRSTIGPRFSTSSSSAPAPRPGSQFPPASSATESRRRQAPPPTPSMAPNSQAVQQPVFGLCHHLDLNALLNGARSGGAGNVNINVFNNATFHFGSMPQ